MSGNRFLIDLFCGIGGVSKGFADAGFTVILAVDAWEEALQVHKKLHPNAKHVLMQLGDSQAETAILSMLPTLHKGDLLHIHASPPCQELSKINRIRNENLGFTMFRWTLKLLNMIVKKYNGNFVSWTIEQVPRQILVEKLKLNEWDCHVYNVQNFQVPQSRKRLVVSNVPLSEVMNKMKIPQVLLKDVIDVPPGTRFIGNCNYTIKNMKEKSPYLSIREYIPEKTVGYTVTSCRQRFLNSKKFPIRSITLAENALLQTLPPGIEKIANNTMIGNAVPPKFAFFIALAVKTIQEIMQQK